MIYSPPVYDQEAESGRGTLEGANMTGEDVRQVFETILPQQDIERLCVQCRVIERQRKLHLGMFDRALAYARTQQVDLPGVLGGVKDWYIVDSTTVTVHDALQKEFPGTGKYAAVNVHKVLSVGCGAPVRYHFSPAREHDSRHLTIDESWRGYGLLADLAYASLARLQACATHGGRFVIRLKDNWKPKVDYIARGRVTPAFFPGTDLDVLLEE